MKKELEQFKEKLFQAAKEKGFCNCEIYAVDGASFSVSIFEGEIIEYKNAGNAGLSFRGTINGKMGYAYSEKTNDDVIPFLVENAAQNAEIIEDTDVESLFAGSVEYPIVKTYEPALSQVSVEDKINAALLLEKAAKEADSRVKAVDYCMFVSGEGEVAIANTLGLNISSKSNYAYSFVLPRIEENNQVKTAGDIWCSKHFEKFDPKSFAENTVKTALSYLGAKSIVSGKYPVIFKNEAATDMLQTFSSIFSADNAQKGFSLLKGKLNEAVASTIVTIRDDALLPDEIGSAPFDSEGVATKNKAVIENGVLKTFLHNLKTASKDGVEPTGNGFKPSFKASVSIEPTNFYIVPGEKQYDELITQMDNGIIVTEVQGMHSGTNAISGDFSVSAEGYRVENGKISHAVEQITIAGNFFELLKDITCIADDLRFFAGNFGAPSILVSKISVSGL